MKNLWMKSVVALAICMTFAACGKSSDRSSVSEPAKPAAPTQPPEQGSEDQTGQGQTPKTPQSATPRSSDAPSRSGSSGTANTDDVQTMLAEAAKYSGSSDDYLRTYVEYKQSQISDEAQKTRNLKLAYGIRSASLKVDYNETGDVAVSVNVGTSEKDRKSFLLGGSLSGQREAKLRASSKKSGVSGTIRCMDQMTDGQFTCENALVSLKMNKAEAKIIFRRTNVKLDARFPNTNCKTQECENMYSLFRQTEIGTGDRITIRKAKLESYEVIQGRSAFRLIIITNQKEVMTVGGPLLNPDVNSVTNIPADRTLNVEDLVDLRTMENFRTNMQHSLNDVRIVGNNGRGLINLQVKMKMMNDGVQDQFQLNLERLQRDLEPIIEINSKPLSKN